MFGRSKIVVEGTLISRIHVASYNQTCIDRSIYKNIILPLARAWEEDDILDVVEKYLVVLTPDVCFLSNALFHPT